MYDFILRIKFLFVFRLWWRIFFFFVICFFKKLFVEYFLHVSTCNFPARVRWVSRVAIVGEVVLRHVFLFSPKILLSSPKHDELFTCLTFELPYVLDAPRKSAPKLFTHVPPKTNPPMRVQNSNPSRGKTDGPYYVDSFRKRKLQQNDFAVLFIFYFFFSQINR